MSKILFRFIISSSLVLSLGLSAQSQSELELLEARPLVDFFSQSLEIIPDGLEFSRICDLATRGVDSSSFESFVNTRSGSSTGVSVVHPEYAEYLFNVLADQTHIPFEYTKDGCYARAHSMVKILDKMGLSSAKVFLEGDLQVTNTQAGKGYVRWWYHVAPMIQVRRGAYIDFVVLDPSLFDRPVTLSEWVELQTSHKNGVVDEQYFTSRFNYLPGDSMSDRSGYQEADIADSENIMNQYLDLLKER